MEQGKYCKRIDKRLLPNKLVFCSLYGALGGFLVFKSVFLKQLGFSPLQIGLIFGVQPFIGVVSGPLIGVLADRFSKRRPLFFMCVIAFAVIYVTLYLTKVPDRVDKCPNNGEPLSQSVYLKTDNDATCNNTNAATPAESNQTSLSTADIGWLYLQEQIQQNFVIIISLVLLGELFTAPSLCLLDASTMYCLGRERCQLYGHQRACGSIGWGMSTFLVGSLLRMSRQKEHVCGTDIHLADYRLVSYVSMVNLILSLVASSRLVFETELSDQEKVKLTDKEVTGEDEKQLPETKHDTWAVFRMFLDVHFGSWLLANLYAGICNGVIWGFLYWHLENLGADQLMMSLTSFTNCILELLFMIFMIHKIISFLGHVGVVYLGLVAFSLRFLVYACMTNPWYALLAEPLHGLSFSTILVSQSSYTTLMVPDVSLGTVQGIVHGVYFGLGAGGGLLLGGVFTQKVGARLTFVVFGVASLVVLVIFFIAQKIGKNPNLDSTYRQKVTDSQTTHHTSGRTRPK